MELLRNTLPIEALSSDQKEEMLALMSKYYHNVNRQEFLRDLHAKNWALLLRESSDNRIVGFSTQKLFEVEMERKPVSVLYSGDTIIDKEYWGSMALMLSFGELVLDIGQQLKDRPFYWMLISKGVRTYKYLPVCFTSYYPNHKEQTPQPLQRLMDLLAMQQFPERYNPVTGILEAGERDQFLDLEYQPEPNPKKEAELFFFERNPGCLRGDELVCLASLHRENIHPFMIRMLAKTTAIQ